MISDFILRCVAFGGLIIALVFLVFLALVVIERGEERKYNLGREEKKNDIRKN